MDKRKRSLAKTVTWRVIALLATIVVAYAFLGKIEESIYLGVAANVLKTVAYYAHERIWARIKWGQ